MAKSKVQIDKESMFNKIMPTSLRNMTNEKSKSDFEKQLQNSVNEYQPKPKQPALDNSRHVPLLKHKDNIMLNIVERIVIQKLDMAFLKFNCCKCDRCRQDVAAIALNKLSPKYIVANEDEIDDIIKKYDDSKITSAIVQAMLIVKANPRH